MIPSSQTLYTKSIRGTFEYMAPELFVKPGARHVESDEYALAIMLYEWLTGEVPFSGNLVQILDGHRNVMPDMGNIPPAIQPVLLRALAKEPDARFPTVGEFVDALHAASQSAVIKVPLITAVPPAPAPMATCPHCLANVNIKAQFCGVCGRALRRDLLAKPQLEIVFSNRQTATIPSQGVKKLESVYIVWSGQQIDLRLAVGCFKAIGTLQDIDLAVANMPPAFVSDAMRRLKPYEQFTASDLTILLVSPDFLAQLGDKSDDIAVLFGQLDAQQIAKTLLISLRQCNWQSTLPGAPRTLQPDQVVEALPDQSAFWDGQFLTALRGWSA